MSACVAATTMLMRCHPATRPVSTVDDTGASPSLWTDTSLLLTSLGAVAVFASSFAAMPSPLIMPSILLGCLLVSLAVFDAKAFVLPNVLTLILLASGLLYASLSTPDLLPPSHGSASILQYGPALLIRLFGTTVGQGVVA